MLKKLRFIATFIIAGLIIISCTAKDPLGKRAQWLSEAKKGNQEAQYQLGKDYCCGYDGIRSTTQALKWFCQSALKGYGPAQYELGRYFAIRSRSHNLPSARQEMIQGYMWYSIAALQRIPLAADERDALANEMHEREVIQAKRRIREWKTLGGC